VSDKAYEIRWCEVRNPHGWTISIHGVEVHTGVRYCIERVVQAPTALHYIEFILFRLERNNVQLGTVALSQSFLYDNLDTLEAVLASLLSDLKEVADADFEANYIEALLGSMAHDL